MKRVSIALLAITLATLSHAAETRTPAPADTPPVKADAKPAVRTLSNPAGKEANESPLVRAANAANAARAKKKSSIVINDSTIKASKTSEANVTTSNSSYNLKFVPTLPPPEARAAMEKNRIAAEKKAAEDEQARRDRIAGLRLELGRIQSNLEDESEDPANSDPEKIERRMTEIQKEIQSLESPVRPKP